MLPHAVLAAVERTSGSWAASIMLPRVSMRMVCDSRMLEFLDPDNSMTCDTNAALAFVYPLACSNFAQALGNKLRLFCGLYLINVVCFAVPPCT